MSNLVQPQKAFASILGTDFTKPLSANEEITLPANYGDGDPNTLDVFLVGKLASGGAALSYIPAKVEVGPKSDIRNSSFITVSTRFVFKPYTAAHEAGRCILDFGENLDLPFNLMNKFTDNPPDTIESHRRLTPEQHKKSREVSEGKLLRQE